MPAAILAFDVYGTLIDTSGVTAALEKIDTAGGSALSRARAAAFAQTWRDKQLEYSFRRALMKQYADFAVCTAQALDYTCDVYNLPATAQQKSALMQEYSRLPPFADVPGCLQALRAGGHNLYAFSNGARAAVEALLQNASLREYFQDIISADDIKTFKPDAAVYHHFMRQTMPSAAADNSAAWLISANPFDIIGAHCAGTQTIWLKRSEAAVFDPWGVTPDRTITTLADLQIS